MYKKVKWKHKEDKRRHMKMSKLCSDTSSSEEPANLTINVEKVLLYVYLIYSF